MKLLYYREYIVLVVIMLICIAMGIHSYQEGYTVNVVKWLIILGMTIVLFIRYRKKKKSN